MEWYEGKTHLPVRRQISPEICRCLADRQLGCEPLDYKRLSTLMPIESVKLSGSTYIFLWKSCRPCKNYAPLFVPCRPMAK
jgi:hypothetical protein